MNSCQKKPALVPEKWRSTKVINAIVTLRPARVPEWLSRKQIHNNIIMLPGTDELWFSSPGWRNAFLSSNNIVEELISSGKRVQSVHMQWSSWYAQQIHVPFNTLSLSWLYKSGTCFHHICTVQHTLRTVPYLLIIHWCSLWSKLL